MIKLIVILTLLALSQTQRMMVNQKKSIQDRIIAAKPNPPLSQDEQLQKEHFNVARTAGQSKFKADYPKEQLTELAKAYQQIVSGIVYTLLYKTDQANIYQISIYYVVWLRQQKDRVQQISIKKVDKI